MEPGPLGLPGGLRPRFGGVDRAGLIPLGDRIPVWLWGPAILVVGISGVLGSVAHATYREALFSGAHRAVGIVVDTVQRTGTADSGPYVIVTVDAVLPGGATIRRELDVGGRRDAQSWIGRRVHFRHRTDSPYDIHDVFYGPDELEKAWREESI